jgi:hypothetical protein
LILDALKVVCRVLWGIKYVDAELLVIGGGGTKAAINHVFKASVTEQTPGRHAVEAGERNTRFRVGAQEMLIKTSVDAARLETSGHRPFFSDARFENAVPPPLDKNRCSPVLSSDKFVILEEEHNVLRTSVW